MKKDYQIVDKNQTRQLTQFFTENGQMLMPMVELIETAQMGIQDLIEMIGRTTIQAVLEISAAGLAGENHQGKAGGKIVRHGRQQGVVPLQNRKVRIERPRLRNREGGSGAEVSIPAYESMQKDKSLPGKILDTMMRGVSTRNYKAILPEACEAVGVSKSSVSREFIEASEKAYQDLLERRWDEINLLAIYLDGIVIGGHNIIAAVGIDVHGYKHVLGLAEGASENAAVVTSLLTHLVEHGVKPGVRRLFIIDGSKALHAGIRAVFGPDNPVQRCRLHKERNVVDHLPDTQKEYAKLTMRAAFSLDAEKGMKRLETLAEQYETSYPGAAASLREGLFEMFTVNRLGIPSSLRRSLVSTNVIESPNSGVRMRTRRVTEWENGSMVMRWAAASFTATEQNFRRVSGYKDIWILESALGRKEADVEQKEELAA